MDFINKPLLKMQGFKLLNLKIIYTYKVSSNSDKKPIFGFSEDPKETFCQEVCCYAHNSSLKQTTSMT